MKTKRLFLIGLGLVVGLAFWTLRAPSAGALEHAYAELLRSEVPAESAAVVVFGDPVTCGPCRIYEPVVHQVLEDRPGVTLLDLKPAHPKARDAAGRMGVMMIPLTLVFGADGKFLDQWVGALEVEQLEARLEARGL